MRTLIADFGVTDLFNLFGLSSTTGTYEIAEVAPPRAEVSESEIMWGPSFVDEELVARLDALRQHGFSTPPGAAAFDD